MTDLLALQAAAHWPQIIGQPVLFMQRENVVYRVETTLGPHALRRHRPGYHGLAALQSELDLMAMLAGQGAPVPTPAPSVSGALLVQIGDRHASLLSWLAGQPMGRSGQPLAFQGAARAELFGNIGRQMARLHRLADRWTPPPGFQRPAWDRDGSGAAVNLQVRSRRRDGDDGTCREKSPTVVLVEPQLELAAASRRRKLQ